MKSLLLWSYDLICSIFPLASGVIYYISDTLAEIVYVVEPMELILIKTKGENP